MIGKLIRTLLGAAIEGIQRFPLTAMAVILTAIVVNLDIAGLLDMQFSRQQQVYPALAAFSILSLVKYIGAESYGYSRVLRHLAALIGGAFAALLAWFARDVGITEIAFFAGLVGALFVAANWFRGTNAGWWFYVVRLLFVAGLAFISVVVFALGVSAIFASLEYLFGIDISGDVYSHIWATCLIAAGPLFALGRIPENFDIPPVIEDDNYAIAGLRLLSDYLAAPLLVIYALILHAYTAKIVITGDVPQNQIGWMVVGFGALVIFFWKMMLPLREVLTLSGRFFLHIWPFLVVVPIALLFYAIWLRIGEYGVTPERYFLTAFGALMMLFALMQMIPRLRNWLPGAASLTVIAVFLGSFGPWGAEMVSIRSQVSQLTKILDENSQVISAEGNRAASILRFLLEYDALSPLRNVIGPLSPDPFEVPQDENKYEFRSRLEKAIGVDAARKGDDYLKGRRNLSFSNGVVSVDGFDLQITDFSMYPSTSGSAVIKVLPGVNLWIEKHAVVVERGGNKVEFSLEQLREFAERAPDTPKARSFKLVSGNKALLLVPNYLNLKNLKIGEKLQIENGFGSIFLRSNDWK